MYFLTLFYILATLFNLDYCEVITGYIGCYSDSKTNRDLPYTFESFSLPNNARYDNCLTFCSENLFAYFGIQNGSVCYCGRSYGKYGPGTSCNMPCRDSPFKTHSSNETTISCGGMLANAVYGTGINVPGPPSSLQITDYDNTTITLKWDAPDITDGNVTQYQVSSVMVETFGELISTVSTVIVGSNSLTVTLRNLKPSSLYNITVAATIDTFKFGPGVTNQSWTKVGIPEFPLQPEIITRSDSIMEILLKPAVVTNGPITAYQVIVLDNSIITLFDENNLYDALNASHSNYPYYITAQLTPEQIGQELKFTVGDSKIYGGFSNIPLKKDGDYSVKLGVISTFQGETAASFSSVFQDKPISYGNPRSSDPNKVIIPALAGSIAVLIILLVSAIIVFILLRRYYGRRRRSLDQELTVQENILNANGATNAFYLDDECDITDLYSSIKELSWQIPKDQLEVLDKILGWGKYGQVHDGIAYKKGHQMEAAVHKTKVIPLLNNKDKQDLLIDLDSLTRLSHHRNIVGLIGIHEDTENIFIVIENPSANNLRNTLRHSRSLDNYPEYAKTCNRISTLTEWQLLEVLVGIGYGMSHLTQNKIIHKTLASCHILVVDGLTPKITDFGLTHYQKEAKPFVPVRWHALESLKHKIFTSYSNVWSFGVIIWECITLGATPYIDTKTSEVANRLSRGHRLPQPRICSDELYQLVLHCWELDPDQRPDFNQLTMTLSTLASEAKEHLVLDLYPGFQYEKYDHNIEYSS